MGVKAIPILGAPRRRAGEILCFHRVVSRGPAAESQNDAQSRPCTSVNSGTAGVARQRSAYRSTDLDAKPKANRAGTRDVNSP
jgi:hypothetical protein